MSEKRSEVPRKERFLVRSYGQLKLWLRKAFSKKIDLEQEKNQPVVFKFIDQTCDLQPYTNNPATKLDFPHRFVDWMSRSDIFFTETHEGFSHNEEANRYLGRVLAKLFKLDRNSRVLEFGCGSNYFIAEGLAESGANITLLDYNSEGGATANQKDTYLPTKSGKKPLNRFPLLTGDIVESLSRGSALEKKGHSFDFIMVNGALVSAGNNFTVGEIALSKYHAQQQSKVNTEDYVDRFYHRIFEVVKALLKEDGVFYFSSSRFAYHGAGFPALKLAEEKAHFIRLIDIAKQCGASKITLIGVTADGIRKNLEFNKNDESCLAQYRKMALLKLFAPLGEATHTLSVEEDGVRRKISKNEIIDMIDNDEKRAELLADSGIAELVNSWIESHLEEANKVVAMLAGPIDGLPEERLYHGLTLQRMQAVKNRNGDIPGDIARIDAVAVQF